MEHTPPVHIPTGTVIIQSDTQIQTDRARIVLIAPTCPRQTWFPYLNRMALCTPYTLPLRQDLLPQGEGQVLHPNLGKLHLKAWLPYGSIMTN